MELTWLGVILIPIGISLIFIAPHRLIHIAVFFVGFTASSVLDFASGKPLSPLHLFASLGIIYQTLIYLHKASFRITVSEDKTILLLLIFMFVALASMIMPVIIDGALMVSSTQLSEPITQPLRLTTENITRPLPLIFGAIFAIYIALTTDTHRKLCNLVKVYVMSGIVVALWGVFQFFCFNVLNIEYPDYLFNNIKLDTARGFAQVLEIDGNTVMRISSVTHEPSVLAKYLLTIVPLVIIAIWQKTPLFSPWRDRIALWLLLTVIFLSTSTTGYIGIVFAFVTCALIISRHRKIKRRLLGWLLPFFCLLLVVLITVQSADELLNTILFSKAESYSAIERSLSVINSWGYFIEYPVLGIGWGIVGINDLVVNLLVNTGLIGFTAFSGLVTYLIIRSMRSLNLAHTVMSTDKNIVDTISSGLTASFIVLIINGIVTGVEFYLGYFYAVIGMLVASNFVLRKQIKQKATNNLTEDYQSLR